MEMRYKNVIMEISGKCNAKCKYCYTGMVNRGLLSSTGGSFLTPENFSKALSFLRVNNMVYPNTHFCLYNYGEPFMHPRLVEIMQIMDSYNYSFELSTNGSIPMIDEVVPYMRNLKTLKFSMCGFSQDSYNKISGLSFSNVKTNIVTILNKLRDSGWEGTSSLKFHIYNHNQNEAELARRFSIDNGMIFTPIHAIIGDLKMQVDWFESASEIFSQEVKKDLVTSQMFHQYAKNMPIGWQCPLKSELVIDENLRILNCCMCTRHDRDDYYRLGELYSFNEESHQRCMSQLGKRCYEQGVGFAMNNFPTYRIVDWYNPILNILKSRSVDVIGGDFIYQSFTNLFRDKDVCWHHFPDIQNYIEISKHKNGIILADSHFYYMQQELIKQGFPATMILGIYNYNIR